MKMAAGAPGSKGNTGEPARLFLGLGFAAFGGSPAYIAMLEEA